MSKFSTDSIKKTQEEADSAAAEKGKVLDAAVEEIFDVLVKHDFRIEEFDLIVNLCNRMMNATYMSRKVSDFRPAKTV